MTSYTAEQLSRTFFNSIGSPAQLNIEVALAVLEKFTGEQRLVGLVNGTTPVLHHLLNLFAVFNHPGAKRGLLEIIFKCLDLGADVNEPYKDDPPLMFKALTFRELHLTKILIMKTDLEALLNAKSRWLTFFLNNLFTVPGEPVPLTKLLLHADTIIRSKPDGFNAFGGIEGIKRLLASASLGNGAKPTVKVAELATDSMTYNQLLSRLGKEGNTVPLIDMVLMLDEISSNVHKVFLNRLNMALCHHNSPLESKDKAAAALPIDEQLLEVYLFILARTDLDAIGGRNALHGLCLSGSVMQLDDLIEVFSQLSSSVGEERRGRTYAQLRAALLTKDVRGHTPISYAVTRWGPSSYIGKALHRFCQLVGIDFATYIQSIPRFQKQSGATSSAAASEEFDDMPALVDESAGDKTECVTSSGGWNTVRLTSEDTTTCDVVEVLDCEGVLPTNKEFFEKYLNTSTPVVFRGATHEKIKSLFVKDSFTEAYGDFVVPVAPIPYPESFGIRSGQATMKQVIALQSEETARQFSVKTSTAESAAALTTEGNLNNITTKAEVLKEFPMYTFCAPSEQWNKRLCDDVPIPRCLTHSADDASFNSNIGDHDNENSAWKFEIQFYLGDVGTGAPIHYHGHAINSLAYGEKKWFLFPPADSLYTTVPTWDAVSLMHNGAGKVKPLQVTQRAGDVLYVPALWGHATVNVQQAIGVAHEFSVESFCME